tara:strand:+ start:364 stop:864 length:501 start_codon:yes stop_codon:yes gene_type:complete
MPKGNYERSNIFDDIEVDDKNYVPTYKRILNQSKRQEATVIGFEDMYLFCRVCGDLKHQADYFVHGTPDSFGRRKLKSLCSDCERHSTNVRDRLKRENNPPDEKCNLCGKECKTELDHCHKSETFRGWLCVQCNTGLGRFGDDPVKLERAIKYLKGELKENKNDKD